MTNDKREKIFTELYNKKIGAVKWYCRRYVGEHEAEELAHDIFLGVFDNLSKFRNESSLNTWLYTCTRNACLNFMRYRNANKRKGITCSLSAMTHENGEMMELGWLKDKSIGALEQAQLNQTMFVLRKEINRLPDVHKECMLAFMEPDGICSYEMASIKLGVAINTARSRLGRARFHLKQRMMKHGSIV